METTSRRLQTRVLVLQGAQQYSGWGRRANTDLRSLHRAVVHGVEDAADDEVIVEAEFNGFVGGRFDPNPLDR